MEDDGVGLRDLAGDRRAFGNDARDRRNQRLRFAADLIERGAAVFQAFEFEPGFFELRARDGAAGDQRFLARQPALDDRDLLVELALPLAHVGDVDRLQSAASHRRGRRPF